MARSADASRRTASRAPLRGLTARAYVVPTEAPESDATLCWDATTVVVVHAEAGGARGLGYTYAHRGVADLVEDRLAPALRSLDALAPAAAWDAADRALRNEGRLGLAARALSAVDCALWDLKARLLDVPLVTLLGAVREGAPLYGSGGFTSYDDATLVAQLAGWVEAGIPRVKMKVGREPARDLERVAAVRRTLGDAPELFVDANGAYSRKEALAWAHAFRDAARVSWLEEPVSSDDVPGLRLLRDRAPAGLEIAAGEYGSHAEEFARLLEAGAVDCLQADVTRCAGYTGLLRVASLCEAHHVDLSAHCAPALTVPAACALPCLRHVELFHDHVRLEAMLFDGLPRRRGDRLLPDLAAPGHGLALKDADARRYAA